jgi:hypothetical protein
LFAGAKKPAAGKLVEASLRNHPSDFLGIQIEKDEPMTAGGGGGLLQQKGENSTTTQKAPNHQNPTNNNNNKTSSSIGGGGQQQQTTTKAQMGQDSAADNDDFLMETELQRLLDELTAINKANREKSGSQRAIPSHLPAFGSVDAIRGWRNFLRGKPGMDGQEFRRFGSRLSPDFNGEVKSL